MSYTDLYIYLPNENNYYNSCFHQTDYDYDYNQFLKNLQLLYFALQNININKIYYVGDDTFKMKHLNDVFQVFQNYYQCFLTNGMFLQENFQFLQKYHINVDICRIKLDDKENKLYLKDERIPSILQLQKLIDNCDKNNIRHRIVMPIHDNVEYDFKKIISMVKYLRTDIVFRKLMFDNFDQNLACSFFEKEPSVFYDLRQNYNLIVKNYNSVYVWLENIYTNINKDNKDYIVFHPNGVLLNNFKKWKIGNTETENQ